MRDYILLATLVTECPSLNIHRREKIQAAPGYGVVFDGATTNGYAGLLVQCLPLWRPSEIKDISYTFESHHPLVPGGVPSPLALFDGLVAAYRELNPYEGHYAAEWAARDKEAAIRTRGRLREWYLSQGYESHHGELV